MAKMQRRFPDHQDQSPSFLKGHIGSPDNEVVVMGACDADSADVRLTSRKEHEEVVSDPIHISCRFKGGIFPKT